MKQTKPLMAFAMIVMGFNVTICKADTVYSIEYAPHSPIKSVPLNDATLKLEIYAYGNPHGYVQVKTDDNKQFSLQHKHNFAVVEIIGEEKYKARCYGYPTLKTETIQITCGSR